MNDMTGGMQWVDGKTIGEKAAEMHGESIEDSDFPQTVTFEVTATLKAAPDVGSAKMTLFVTGGEIKNGEETLGSVRGGADAAMWCAYSTPCNGFNLTYVVDPSDVWQQIKAALEEKGVLKASKDRETSDE